MLKDVIEAHPLDGYQLHLRFEDGVEGVVDLQRLVRFEGVFAPVAERSNFLQVRVDPELGTVCWPSGADLDPDVLYAEVTGESMNEWHRFGQHELAKAYGPDEPEYTMADIKPDLSS